jgi:hypothetical protein
MQAELEFLGMATPAKSKENNPLEISKQNRERRKLLQVQFEEDYLKALITTKEKILRMEGPDMKQTIQDEFRHWYMEYKRINGKFPDFPEDEVWQRPDFKFSAANLGNEIGAVKNGINLLTARG